MSLSRPNQLLGFLAEGHQPRDGAAVLGYDYLLAALCDFVHKLKALGLELRCLD